jgi:hypothetical protein
VALEEFQPSHVSLYLEQRGLPAEVMQALHTAQVSGKVIIEGVSSYH